MNVNDSERVTGMLEAAGWESAADSGPADLVFLNTCAVREKAESKLFSELGRIRDQAAAGDEAARPLVAVGGCVAQLRGTALLERDRGIDILIGPRSLAELPEIARVALASAGEPPRVALDRPGQEVFGISSVATARPSSQSRALVTVMEGCNQVCSFCVVPRTRGTETFRPPSEIVAEVRHWVERGFAEAVLLGQTVNAYRWDGLDFAGLLSMVAAAPGLRRLRFATSHPRYLTDSLTTAFAQLPNLCPHLHLPVQSGSNRILAAMRRGYDREGYLGKLEALRREAPDVAVWTDVIVGYPGESDADFEETLELVQNVGFAGLFSFTYSPRPGTVAARVPDDVPSEVKRARLARVNQLQQSIQLERNRQRIGRRESVLFEAVGRDGQLEGRTPHNRIVHCAGPASAVGRIRDVEITSAGPNSLAGLLTE
jgi:tRNA-2-methylthio-N6-dimethylallyladenosine synthase